jgi:CubicO group peptidase (beta-lactamase class C family)
MLDRWTSRKLFRRVLVGIPLGLLIVSAAFETTATAQDVPPVNFGGINRFLKQEMEKAHIPGLALAVVHNGRVVHSTAFGVADPDERKVSTGTPFILGSTTKSFTALAVMQLVDEGRIDLSAPVVEYLPWFRVGKGDASDLITVSQLLNHTSGISEATGRERLADGDTSEGALEKHVRALRSATLSRRPGNQFQYSNSNYSTLGLIIQKVSGQSYESYIQEHIFRPLTMRKSFTSESNAKNQGMATGYRYWFGQPRPAPDLRFVRGAAPAGYLISSADDMARYLLVQLGGGELNGVRVVSENGLKLMHKPTSKLSKEWSYAMGWAAGTQYGEPILWHNGGIANFYSYMAIFPESQWGVVVLMNAFDILDPNKTELIALGVTDLMFGGDVAEKAKTAGGSITNMAYGVPIILITLQILWIVASIKYRKRWLIYSDDLHSKNVWTRIVVPPVLAVFWAWIVLAWFPGSTNATLAVMLLYSPAPTMLLYLSAAIAAAWAAVQVALEFRTMKIHTKYGQHTLE